MAVGAREHVVVLVPGFLPFAKGVAAGAGASCHVATVLRSALEAFYGLSIPVVTLPHSASLDLAGRQRTLLRQLQELDGALRGVRHFHLVGHGPGGVDAELLSAQYPLKNSATWLDLDPSHLRERISSIVTIGAPHQGTLILEQESPHATSGSSTGECLRRRAKLFLALAQRLLPAAKSAKSYSRESLAVLAHSLRLVRNAGSSGALSPSRMQALRTRNRPDASLSVQVENVVVVAPDLMFAQAGITRGRDRLFAALHALTSKSGSVDSSLNLNLGAKILRGVPACRVVRHASASVPAFDLAANDGLVNAAHQVLVSHGHQAANVLAIAIADHADVIGYHARQSPFVGQNSDSGLFRSGANFGDDEFFQLWGHIAAHIAGIARARSESPAFSPADIAAQ